MNRIEELNQSLKDAWASDQKVKALKIVIQVRPRNFLFPPSECPVDASAADRGSERPGPGRSPAALSVPSILTHFL